MSAPEDRLMRLGRLGSPFGVKGQVRVHLFTQEWDTLLKVPVWHLVHDSGATTMVRPESGRKHQKSLVASVAGWSSPEEVAPWVNAWVDVQRSALPPLPEGEFYWSDLVGCEAHNDAGEPLGVITEVADNGVHGILILKKSEGTTCMVPLDFDAVVGPIDWDKRQVLLHWSEAWRNDTEEDA